MEMAVQIVRLILSIFVKDNLQFVNGAVEIKFISLKLENSVTMEILLSMMAVQITVKFCLIGTVQQIIFVKLQHAFTFLTVVMEK